MEKPGENMQQQPAPASERSPGTSRNQGIYSNLDATLRKQTANFKAFARTVANINIDGMSENWEFEDALKQLESRWSAIDNIHWDIDSELGGSNLDYEITFTTHEQEYNMLKKNINKKMWSVKHREKCTPKLEIPVFYGDYTQWVSFKDLFNEAVHNNPTLPSAQKMQFLKSKVKGEAERLIQHLTISSENYSTCWEILNHRYNNIRLIFTSHMNTFFGLPNIQQQNIKQIKKIHDSTVETLHAIRNLGVDTTSWDPLIVHILSQKLDAETFTDYLESVKKPRELPILQEFLDYLEMARAQDDAPYLKILARNSVYNVGEQKAIFCQGHNLEDKNGVWYSPSGAPVESKRGDRVHTYKDTKKQAGITVFPLIIQNVQLTDSGNWTCRAGELSDTIEIFVGDKVYFPVRNDNAEFDEGMTAKIDCIAKGSPKPAVQWYKDMVPIGGAGVGDVTVDPKKYWINKKPDNYYLEVKKLDYADSGEYVCKVTQEALSHYMDKRTQLTVHHKPLLINHETQKELPNYVKSQEVYAILNEVKNITCSAIAYPPPEYTWRRQINHYDEEVPSEDGPVVTSEDSSVSVLMLQVTEKSLGQYKCTAMNNKGKVSIIYHVTLGNKPDPPDYVSWVNATANELVFNVSCSTCRMEDEPGVAPDPTNLKILGFSFMLTPVQEGFTVPDWELGQEILVDIVDPFDTFFAVGPLQNNTKFYARVRSRNAAGFSDWMDVAEQPATTAGAFEIVASLLVIAITVICGSLMR